MENLNSNWITEKHTDFESKKYTLLGYLKKITQAFKSQHLYPAYDVLETEYHNLLQLKSAFSLLENRLSKNIKHIDIQNYKIVYQSIYEDDKLMQEIAAIVDFSIPQVERLLTEGNKIMVDVEQKILISPIGLSPLRLKEGYLLLNCAQTKQIAVYSYSSTFYEKADLQFPTIKTQFVGEYQRSIIVTYDFIKQDLIKANKAIPNPATYLVSTELNIPMDFTLLPIAKKKLTSMIN